MFYFVLGLLLIFAMVMAMVMILAVVINGVMMLVLVMVVPGVRRLVGWLCQCQCQSFYPLVAFYYPDHLLT